MWYISTHSHKHTTWVDNPELAQQQVPPPPTHTHTHTCTYLAEWIYQLVLESQLPHKTVNKFVNLLFNITNQNNELTVLWGS